MRPRTVSAMVTLLGQMGDHVSAEMGLRHRKKVAMMAILLMVTVALQLVPWSADTHVCPFSQPSACAKLHVATGWLLGMKNVTILMPSRKMDAAPGAVSR